MRKKSMRIQIFYEDRVSQFPSMRPRSFPPPPVHESFTAHSVVQQSSLNWHIKAILSYTGPEDNGNPLIADM